jgi:hypothetical protein
MHNKDIQKELEVISKPVASNIVPGRQWNIPETYFSDNENLLMSQVKIASGFSIDQTDIPERYFEENENEMVRRFQRSKFSMKVWIQVAATAAILVAIVFFWNHKVLWKTEDPELAVVYLIENLDDFETDDFIDYQLLDEEVIASLPLLGGMSGHSFDVEPYLEDSGDFFEEENEDLF